MQGSKGTARWIKPKIEFVKCNFDAAIFKDRWIKPKIGFVKCNVGAAIFKDRCCIGADIIIRDERGSFVQCSTKIMQCVCEAQEAETWALRVAIKWVISLSFRHVVFEVDAQSMVNTIYSNGVEIFEFG